MRYGKGGVSKQVLCGYKCLKKDVRRDTRFQAVGAVLVLMPTFWDFMIDS